MSPSIPQLPDVARSLLKSAIRALADAGLITGLDAETLLAILKLGDA